MAYQLPRILKGFSAFVDGKGYAGRLDEVALPKLTIKTEEHRDGGMDGVAEIDMGMEKLESTLTFAEYDEFLARRFGLLDQDAVGITCRGSMEDHEGVVTAIEVNMRGSIKEIDDGDWKSGGEKAQRKFQMALIYYRYRTNGRDDVEIDVEGARRVIDGVDQLTARRIALGEF